MKTPSIGDTFNNFCMFPAGDILESQKAEAVENPADKDDDWRVFFDTPEEKEDKYAVHHRFNKSVRESVRSPASHKTVFSACWFSLLSELPKSAALSTRALSLLHTVAIPCVSEPLKFMDWVACCVDLGGEAGLLALNTLHQLIVRNNLDYPDFYRRLYGFIDQELLHSKHRSRFFRLAEVFLSSTHLPAALLASFIKRISRLSLRAPPGALSLIIPFVYNILKSHPTLMEMIHNPVFDLKEDPYDPSQEWPLLTRALQSSLWELNSQRDHYLGSVSVMAQVFSQTIRTEPYDLDDFSDHSTTTIFDNECSQRMGRPVLAFAEPMRAVHSDDPIAIYWQVDATT